jgi:hypothetical protein
MSTRTGAFAVSVGLLLSIMFVAGCSSSSKSSNNNTTTTAANKGFDISTPAGQVSLSLNGNLPPGWPTGFPVPTDATPAGSGSLVNSSKDVMVGAYTTTGTPSSAYNFYKTNSSLTVTEAKNVGVGGAFVGTVQFKGTYSGSVTVAGRNSKTYLVVVLKGSSTATTSSTSSTSSTTTVSG